MHTKEREREGERERMYRREKRERVANSTLFLPFCFLLEKNEKFSGTHVSRLYGSSKKKEKEP